jgi:hypothetical protein
LARLAAGRAIGPGIFSGKDRQVSRCREKIENKMPLAVLPEILPFKVNKKCVNSNGLLIFFH